MIHCEVKLINQWIYHLNNFQLCARWVVLARPLAWLRLLEQIRAMARYNTRAVLDLFGRQKKLLLLLLSIKNIHTVDNKTRSNCVHSFILIYVSVPSHTSFFPCRLRNNIHSSPKNRCRRSSGYIVLCVGTLYSTWMCQRGIFNFSGMLESVEGRQSARCEVRRVFVGGFSRLARSLSATINPHHSQHLIQLDHSQLVAADALSRTLNSQLPINPPHTPLSRELFISSIRRQRKNENVKTCRLAQAEGVNFVFTTGVVVVCTFLSSSLHVSICINLFIALHHENPEDWRRKAMKTFVLQRHNKSHRHTLLCNSRNSVGNYDNQERKRENLTNTKFFEGRPPFNSRH